MNYKADSMNCSNLMRTISQIEAADFVQAKVLQSQLARQIVLTDEFTQIKSVAGLDVGLTQNKEFAIGGVVVLSYPELEVIDKQACSRKIVFPYVPGFLSFREIPVLLGAWQKLSIYPDLLLCDGQGIAHPRRFGLACHLGIILNLPSIGVAKTRLIGEFTEPLQYKGAVSKLTRKGEQIGSVLRTRTNTKPLYISPGHKISQDSANQWVLNCCPRFRLPETTRQAHKLVSS